MSPTASRSGRAVVRLTVWTAAFVAAAYVGRATIIDGAALSLVWPAAGVAMLWFATSDRERVVLDAAVFSAAGLVVNMTTGAPPDLALVFLTVNLVQVGLFLGLARRWVPQVWGFGGRRALSRLDELGTIVLAALVACLCAASLGSLGMWLTGTPGSVLTFLTWWGRNAVGVVAVGLVGLLAGPELGAAYRRSGLRGALERVRRWLTPTSVVHGGEALGLGAATLGIYLLVFTTQVGGSLAFALLVPTFWAGIRFSALTATVHSLACAGLAVGLTLRGGGPFLAFHEPVAEALAAQLCMLITMVAGLSLAFSHARERTVAAELTSLMDASRLVALICTDLDGRIRTFGVGAERMLGCSADTVVGRARLADFVDTDELDAAALEHGVPAGEVLAELARHEGDARTWTFVRRDGSRLFARLALSQLHDASGAVAGYLGVAIDMTQAVRNELALVTARDHAEDLQRQLAHQANHDALTGLPNRRWFEKELARRLTGGGQGGALLLLDLDHFKAVNDTLGHVAGDHLLVSLAQVMRAKVRRSDALARIGGDEFAVVLGDVDAEGAATVAQSLVDGVRELTASLPDSCSHVTLSVGGVPLRGTDADELFQAADRALYAAKHNGRDQQVIQDPRAALPAAYQL